ncbi:Peptidase family M41 [Rhizobium sp. RU20A]|uniref:ATP-dependent Zn protease n=1 Tax=Rhizobium sp. RU20A TaxID=1907412 RepID=UPI0009549E88|nr:ATP-dependent Zn protease [Rhizobium sp. RU20A]SIR21286.1 Peptidase family M41 [Rhizobium sp. RU20A]
MKTGEHPQSLDNLRPLALLALGRSGADIERLVREVRRSLRRLGKHIVWSDIETALRQAQPRLSDELAWRVSVHEAGHVLVYTLTGIAEVESASIGLNGLGRVTTVANSHLPETEAWLMNSIAATLAGRAAERLVIGDVLAGAGGAAESDLARATEMALAAETRLGFARHRPLLYRSASTASHALTIDDTLAARVDARLTAAEAIATRLIEAHRDRHRAIARRLAAATVVEGDELRAMLDGAVEPDA